MDGKQSHTPSNRSRSARAIMTSIDALRALARYQTHGGYTWAAVMDDGELVCTRCIRDNYRQVFRSTRDQWRDGWQVEGLTNSGESEESASCANCNREIWEGQS